MSIEKDNAHKGRVTHGEQSTPGSNCDEIVEGRLLSTASRSRWRDVNNAHDAHHKPEIGVEASGGILERIRMLLRDANVPYRELEHEATYTSEQSAQARGEDLSVGAKALLVKADGGFNLLVLPADRKLDSAAAKREFGARKSRFATPDELKELTGLVPGCVPPFGEPVLPFDLYVDVLVGQQVDKVAFNAGSLTQSIVMKASDWETVAKPRRFKFSK